MSEISGTAVAHEAYAFCCMRCGHGWEQAYDIEHHVDGSGKKFVVYKADGLRVPSPISSPSCVNCAGNVVRIMRAGQVSSARAMALPQFAPAKGEQAATGSTVLPSLSVQGMAGGIPARSQAQAQAQSKNDRHRHGYLYDLLHALHLR